MADIVISGYHGDFISKDGKCYYFVETTTDPTDATNTGIIEYNDCAECEVGSLSSSSSSLSSVNSSSSSLVEELVITLDRLSTNSQLTIIKSAGYNSSSSSGDGLLYDSGCGNTNIDETIFIDASTSYEICVTACSGIASWDALVTSTTRPGYEYGSNVVSVPETTQECGTCPALGDEFSSSSNSSSSLSSSSDLSSQSDLSSLSSDSSDSSDLSSDSTPGGDNSSSSSAPVMAACGTPNGDPTIFITLTFGGGGTKTWLGCTWNNGETKEVYANIYNEENYTLGTADIYRRQKWLNNGNGVTGFISMFRDYLQFGTPGSFTRQVGVAIKYNTGQKTDYFAGTQGGVFTFPKYSSLSIVTSLDLPSLVNYGLLAKQKNNTFTDVGGVTYTWTEGNGW